MHLNLNQIQILVFLIVIEIFLLSLLIFQMLNLLNHQQYTLIVLIKFYLHIKLL